MRMYKEYKICQIGEVIGGGTPSTSNEAYWNGSIPWITPKDLTEYSSVYISYGEDNISEAGLNESGTRLLPKNTVLFSSRAPIGYVAIAQNPICTNQGFKSIICDEAIIDPLYFYYYIKANLDYFKLWGSGATFPEISGNVMKRIKIRIIDDINQQKKTASLLYSYDKLIEVNNKRIKVLEQMAENLYKEWFVRFRFPGHETAEFENGIPKGWGYKRIGDIATIKSGFAFKSEWWVEEGIPAIKIKDIVANTIDLSDLSRVDREHADKAKQFYVSAGDLLIALTGATIGKIALVPIAEKMTVNQRVGKFFLSDSPWKSVAFLFCFFLQDKVQEEIISIAGSNAAQPNISPFDVENLKTYYDIRIVKEFNNLLAPVILSILKLRKQNDILIKQRDLLLPRLMSGKLEVK